MTWQNWVTGLLGLLVVVLPFLALDANTQRTVMVVAGLVIAVLSFWGLCLGMFAKKAAPSA